MVKRYFQNLFYTLPVCAGIAALAAVLSGHSDEKNALVLGFSKFRVLLIITALGFLLFAVLVFFSRKKKQTYRFAYRKSKSTALLRNCYADHCGADLLGRLKPH